MEKTRNSEILYKSNFNFLEEYNSLPPIKLKINDCSKEISKDLSTLKEERYLSDNNSFNNNKKKKNNISNQIFNIYNYKSSVIKPSLHQSEKTKSSLLKTINNFNFLEDPIKLRLKKIKLQKLNKEKEESNKIKYYLTSSNLEDIKADKNKIIKELKELDKSSSLTNKIISKRNAEKNKDILIFIKKRIKRDKKMLFLNDEFLQPEKIKPFDIPNKNIAFYSNLDNMINKIKESSLSSSIILQNLKRLNDKKKERLKRLNDTKIQNKGFAKFDKLISSGEIIKKDFDVNYEKIQRNLKKDEIQKFN
jgi:hypothetical protein